MIVNLHMLLELTNLSGGDVDATFTFSKEKWADILVLLKILMELIGIVLVTFGNNVFKIQDCQ